MPLVKCEECEALVSDKAQSCPKCGHPVAAPRDERYDPPTRTQTEFENTSPTTAQQPATFQMQAAPAAPDLTPRTSPSSRTYVLTGILVALILGIVFFQYRENARLEAQRLAAQHEAESAAQAQELAAQAVDQAIQIERQR